MNDAIREQLIGYVLGALDERESLAIEQRLAMDAQWRGELAAVQQLLEPLAESYDEQVPPRNLTERTCEFVERECRQRVVTRPSRLSRGNDHLGSSSSWSLADWLVAGGICAAAVLLFFPTVLNSRSMARLVACQDNLRELGTSLVQYSEYVGRGFFPTIPTDGNRAFAGFQVPILHDANLLTDSQSLVCPDSSLATAGSSFRLPAIREVDAARGATLLIIQRAAGGSYASSLGVIVNGRHMPIGNMQRTTFALLADAPQNSRGWLAHRSGQNVLYEDLHIAFVCNGPEVQLADDPFENRFGHCEAGIDVNDAVLGRSEVAPLRNKVTLTGGIQE